MGEAFKVLPIRPYLSEIGQKCEIQYCVVVWDGNWNPHKNYRWISKGQLQEAVKKFKRDPLVHNNMSLCVRIKDFEETPTLEKRRSNTGWGRLIKKIGFMSDIEVHVVDERWANLCADKLKFPVPFPNVNYK